jgi:hypothetical protein
MTAAVPIPTLETLRWGEPRVRNDTLRVYARLPRVEVFSNGYFHWYREHREEIKADGILITRIGFNWLVCYQCPATEKNLEKTKRGIERWRLAFAKACSRWSPSIIEAVGAVIADPTLVPPKPPKPTKAADTTVNDDSDESDEKPTPARAPRKAAAKAAAKK